MTCSTLLFRGARHAGTTALLAAALGIAAPAQAQLGLPRMNLPTLPTLPSPPRELQRLPDVTTGESARSALPLTLKSLRANTVRELLREHADVLEADPAGEPVRRQELLLIAPTQPIVDAARALGFAVLREEVLVELSLRQVVLSPPKGRGTAESLARLRAIDPQVDADFNHVYTLGGENGEIATGRSDSTAASNAGIRCSMMPRCAPGAATARRCRARTAPQWPRCWWGAMRLLPAAPPARCFTRPTSTAVSQRPLRPRRSPRRLPGWPASGWRW